MKRLPAEPEPGKFDFTNITCKWHTYANMAFKTHDPIRIVFNRKDTVSVLKYKLGCNDTLKSLRGLLTPYKWIS